MALQVQFAMIERWPLEKIQMHQMAQVQSLINHAQKTVPFYEDKLASLVSIPLGSLTMEEFRKIPLLTRTMIQDAGESLVTRSLPASHGRMSDVRTSGSTGRPVEIKGTDITKMMFSAQGIRYHMWHQRDLNLKNMTIRPEVTDSSTTVQRSRGWTTGSLGENVYVNHTMPAPEILDILLMEKPFYMQCFPTTLRELLRLSNIKGVKPKNLRDVRTISEILEPELVTRAADQWGVLVTNNYSAQEINVIALQCPDNPKNLHIMAESVLLEVLDEDGNPCLPGQQGRCVATTLVNYATPLIRYEYGDYVEVGHPCCCGRGLPTISKIMGRRYNLMVLPNGDKFTPSMPPDDALFELPIRQYQLVQTSLEEVEVRIATDRKLTSEEESRLTSIYTERKKYPFRFVVCYMDEIPRLANGKYDLFRCEVDT